MPTLTQILFIFVIIMVIYLLNRACKGRNHLHMDKKESAHKRRKHEEVVYPIDALKMIPVFNDTVKERRAKGEKIETQSEYFAVAVDLVRLSGLANAKISHEREAATSHIKIVENEKTRLAKDVGFLEAQVEELKEKIQKLQIDDTKKSPGKNDLNFSPARPAGHVN